MRFIYILLGAVATLLASDEVSAAEIYAGEPGARELQTQCKAKIDLVNILDGSGSIPYPVYVNEVVTAQIMFAKAFTLSATETQFALTTFSDTHSVEVELGSAASKNIKKLLPILKGLGSSYYGGGTYPLSAFEHVLRHQLPNKRVGSTMVVVFTTDGSFYAAQVIEIMKKLKAAGVIPVCISVGPYVDQDVMEQLCDAKYRFAISNFAGVINAIDQIANTICTVTTPSPVATKQPTSKAPTRTPTTMAPTTRRPTTATPTTLHPTASPTNATEPVDFCDENWLQYLICNPWWLLIPVFRRRIELELRKAQGNPPTEIVKPIVKQTLVGAAKGDSLPHFYHFGSLATMTGVTQMYVPGDNEVTDRETARKRQEENIAKINKLKETHKGAHFFNYATNTLTSVDMDRLERAVPKTAENAKQTQTETSNATPGKFSSLDLQKLFCCCESVCCCCPKLIAQFKEKIGTPGLGFFSLKWMSVVNDLDPKSQTHKVTDRTVELWVTSFWAWEVPLFIADKVCHVRVPWERGENLYIVAASELKAFLTRKWQQRTIKDNTTPLSSRAATAAVKSTDEQSDKNWYNCCLEMWKQREKQNPAAPKPASKPVTAFSSAATTKDKSDIHATKPVVVNRPKKPDVLSKSMFEPATKKANTALTTTSGHIDMPTGGLSIKERAKKYGG